MQGEAEAEAEGEEAEGEEEVEAMRLCDLVARQSSRTAPSK
jgi:hypothetical protein